MVTKVLDKDAVKGDSDIPLDIKMDAVIYFMLGDKPRCHWVHAQAWENLKLSQPGYQYRSYSFWLGDNTD